jgi:Arc/MetJ-type ribon-helix-helix transcriptional regulator
MVPVTVKFDDASLAQLDAFIERGAAGSRTEALRAALKSWLKAQRDAELVEQYRKGYGEFPVEDDPDLAPWATTPWPSPFDDDGEELIP